MIDLYGYLGPNVRKIVIALAELDLEYRVRWVDITAGEQFDPAYRAVNPNAKVPALVDHDGETGVTDGLRARPINGGQAFDLHVHLLVARK